MFSWSRLCCKPSVVVSTITMSSANNIKTMSYQYLTANKDPKTGLYKPTEYKSNFEIYVPKPYEPKEYVDPLKVPVRQYEYKEFVPRVYTPPQYNPVMTVREYKLPNIDPLTGKPRRPRKIVRDGREIILDNPDDQQPSNDGYSSRFPPGIGSSVGSIRRTLKFHEPTNGESF